MTDGLAERTVRHITKHHDLRSVAAVTVDLAADVAAELHCHRAFCVGFRSADKVARQDSKVRSGAVRARGQGDGHFLVGLDR